MLSGPIGYESCGRRTLGTTHCRRPRRSIVWNDDHQAKFVTRSRRGRVTRGNPAMRYRLRLDRRASTKAETGLN